MYTLSSLLRRLHPFRVGMNQAAVNIMLAAGLAESLNEHCGDNVRRLLANAVVVVDAVHPPRVATF